LRPKLNVCWALGMTDSPPCNYLDVEILRSVGLGEPVHHDPIPICKLLKYFKETDQEKYQQANDAMGKSMPTTGCRFEGQTPCPYYKRP